MTEEDVASKILDYLNPDEISDYENEISLSKDKEKPEQKQKVNNAISESIENVEKRKKFVLL